MPAALPIDWESARRAAETGAPLRLVAERYGAEYEAVRKRSQRERWLIPSRVETLREKQRQFLIEQGKKEGLSQTVPQPPKETSSQLAETQGTPPAPEQVTAESLAVMGQSLRSTVLQKTLAALKRADLASLPIDSWSDAKTAVEVGLKASGLEAAAGQGPSVNVLFSSAAPPVIEIDGHKSGPRPAPAIEDLL